MKLTVYDHLSKAGNVGLRTAYNTQQKRGAWAIEGQFSLDGFSELGEFVYDGDVLGISWAGKLPAWADISDFDPDHRLEDGINLWITDLEEWERRHYIPLWWPTVAILA